jgi:TPR repeat protein
LYANGRGAQADDAEAAIWYRKAAEHGHDAAQYVLGSSYALGRGVPQDNIQALMWLNLSAAQGNSDALRNRDFVAFRMTPQQLAEARRLTDEWKQKR